MSVKIRTVVGSDKCGCIVCPNCGAHELLNCHLKAVLPVEKWRWQIRPFKVDDWSHCLVCSCWFNLEGKIQGNRKVPLAAVTFSEAREYVKSNFPKASKRAKLCKFVEICQRYCLAMEHWSDQLSDEQVDLMVQGYELV